MTDTSYKCFLEGGSVEIDLEIMLVGTVKAKLFVAWYDRSVPSLELPRPNTMFWKMSLWGKHTGC